MNELTWYESRPVGQVFFCGGNSILRCSPNRRVVSNLLKKMCLKVTVRWLPRFTGRVGNRVWAFDFQYWRVSTPIRSCCWNLGPQLSPETQQSKQWISAEKKANTLPTMTSFYFLSWKNWIAAIEIHVERRDHWRKVTPILRTFLKHFAMLDTNFRNTGRSLSSEKMILWKNENESRQNNL